MEIRQLYEALEDENHHNLTALLVCVARRDYEGIVRMGEIIKQHQAFGHMLYSSEQERYRISQPHYEALAKEGVFTVPPVTVNLMPDFDMESPCETDGWKAYSFSTRHGNFKSPGDLGFDEDGRPDDDLRAKLDAGLAFILDYFEHGNCIWSLSGGLPPGANCPWDSVSGAGILIWEDDIDALGPKSYEERREDAKRFIKRFTDWCNGSVFGYSIDDPDGKVDDSCFGFYDGDLDYMFQEIREAVGNRKVVFAGDCRDLADYYWEKK